MKGVIFNLLESVIIDAHGSDAWEDLLDDTGLDGIYSGVGQYPDAELMQLVGAASTRLGTPVDDLVRWFGERSMPLLAATYPDFFECPDTRTFLLRLNQVIHAEVKKLMPDAYLPEFDYDEDAQGRLLMSYRSDRRLCMFGEGLVLGAAAQFGETVRVSQEICALTGADECRFVVEFT